MANLEEADTTEKMIKALSSLFRYNLKTKEAEVALAQEIRVVKDYMYLQQMRFGDRITYSLDCATDLYTAIVPTFTFQTLVENAIIHGLSKQEEGGKIDIRIWLDTNLLNITIADTGIGMTNEKLLKLRKAFGTGDTQRLGIGLGNIYKRIHGMYENGVVEVYSKLNEGTVIKLIIPQGEWEVKSHV